MEAYEWILSALASSAAIGAAGYLCRDVIKAWLEKNIQHTFDERIETLRASLRQSEELFKRDLRVKEAEIAALRTGALGGLATRQALLAKRKLEAVERIWSAVVDLAPAKSIAATMSVFKIEAVAKEAPKNANLRQMFQIIGKPYNIENITPGAARYERPFVTPLVWALFSAFQTVVFYAVAQVKVLEMGLEGATQIMDEDKAKSVLKAALPHQSANIDRLEATAFYYFLDEIEEKLISALRNMLDGAEADQANVVQAAAIMKAIELAVADSIAKEASAASSAISNSVGS